MAIWTSNSRKASCCETGYIEVTNTTKHDILLPNWTVLGPIELVQSVTPVEVKFKEWPKAQTEHKLESEPT